MTAAFLIFLPTAPGRHFSACLALGGKDYTENLFSMEFYPVVLGADLPKLSRTPFADGARDFQQLSGKTANEFDGNGTNPGERDFDRWLEMIQQEAISSNFTNSSNRTSSEYGNVDGPAKVITVAQTGVADF
jgi:hypothetical protein